MNVTEWGMVWIVALFILGLVCLFAGGNALVHGSSRLARLLGIHPIIVGLTVVAFGTSMPEFIVSLIAAIKNKTDVALGNIVGSNVSNIALILGLSALCRPITINLRILKFEMPLVLAISLYFWLICANHVLSRIDGLTLFLGFLIYLVIVILGASKGSEVLEEKFKPLGNARKTIGFNLVFIVIGIVGLTLGANWTVNSAAEISRRAGVPELILGLTIVAIGTSLPELATSMVAALKNEGDISIGNILGSNIFNMMAIAGPTALVQPLPVSKALIYYHLPIMVGLTLVLFLLLLTRHKLTRLEGGFLLLCYVVIFTWWTS
ncbi:MAG: calcium/sodium antiporter [bacterium]